MRLRDTGVPACKMQLPATQTLLTLHGSNAIYVHYIKFRLKQLFHCLCWNECYAVSGEEVGRQIGWSGSGNSIDLGFFFVDIITETEHIMKIFAHAITFLHPFAMPPPQLPDSFCCQQS